MSCQLIQFWFLKSWVLGMLKLMKVSFTTKHILDLFFGPGNDMCQLALVALHNILMVMLSFIQALWQSGERHFTTTKIIQILMHLKVVYFSDFFLCKGISLCTLYYLRKNTIHSLCYKYIIDFIFILDTIYRYLLMHLIQKCLRESWWNISHQNIELNTKMLKLLLFSIQHST